MTSLSLNKVSKVFDDGEDGIVAVRDLDIEIEDGEFVVFVGPSGCGKSTTLRMIAGLESITRGEITLAGERLNDVAPQNRNIAMVFQSYALYPHMTVRGNMSFGLEESTDLSNEEIGERVESTAETMEIGDLLDRKPSELSGGQQQRVALGRAIVRDPEVFLMDEPLSNLDAKLRAQMRTELQRLQDELNTTTIYVTHDQTEAMTMGDRIAILNDGVLQQIATPLEAYHRPANEFVAGFIGEPSMNFFDVDVTDDGLVSPNFTYPISEGVRSDIGDVGRATLGIRPQDVEVVESVEGEHDFEASVDVVEPKGDTNNVYLNFPDMPERETFIAVVEGRHPVRSGDTVAARLPETAVHVFDDETGDALHSRDLGGDIDASNDRSFSANVEP